MVRQRHRVKESWIQHTATASVCWHCWQPGLAFTQLNEPSFLSKVLSLLHFLQPPARSRPFPAGRMLCRHLQKVFEPCHSGARSYGSPGGSHTHIRETSYSTTRQQVSQHHSAFWVWLSCFQNFCPKYQSPTQYIPSLILIRLPGNFILPKSHFWVTIYVSAL